MDPEAQIVGADAWLRLRLYWLAGDEKCARDLLDEVLPRKPQAGTPPDVARQAKARHYYILGALRDLARRVARWSDLRRELYLGVLRRRVEAP